MIKPGLINNGAHHTIINREVKNSHRCICDKSFNKHGCLWGAASDRFWLKHFGCESNDIIDFFGAG